VRDPDPHAIDGGEVLGLRFDVFSILECGFVRPYYVLLNAIEPTPGGEKKLRVHKHTIPVFVPLKELEARYLPVSDGEQDLVRLAREVRRGLVSFHKRRDAVERVKVETENTDDDTGISEIREVDPSAREFEIGFKDKSVAKVRIDIDGAIVNAVVRTTPTGGSGERGNSAGRRKRDLERVIVGGNGRIESLTQRLRAKNRLGYMDV
jgi:central kinetochore subunit Mal2/MCM21